MPPREVFVSGVGVVSPLGGSWPETAAALETGATAVRAIEQFDVAGYPCSVGAWVEDDFGGTPDRRRAIALRAAREAWADAGLRAPLPGLGVFVGAESGRATLSTILALARAAGGGAQFDHQAFGTQARALAERIDPTVVSPAAVASTLAGELGSGGPAITISIACASGAAAIIEAVRALRLGTCEVALAGGVGADVDPLMLAGFGKLGALSAKGISRPFDTHRDGFVVGEGAAMLVLTTEPGPIALTGVGRSLDAHHLTAPDPEGGGATRAMRAALADAGSPRIGYVQAHGTSTPLNDAVEARAIAAVLAAPAPIGSVKGAVGHWIAGAGAIGTVAAVHAVGRGVLLPTAGLEDVDPACVGDHVVGEARRAPVGAALVNSFAFGGANACLVVEARS